MMGNATCATCRWWGKEGPGAWNGGWGADCHRHAPVRSLADYPTYGRGVWPSMLKDDWCGDHAPKPPTQAMEE